MPVQSHPQPLPSSATLPEAGGEPAPIPGASRVEVLLDLPPAHNFRYLVNPRRYDVFVTSRGPEILPVPSRFEFQPGLAGVVPVRGHEDGDPTYALLERAKKGWIEVPDHFPVTAFGVPMSRYCQAYRVKTWLHHCEVWTRPYMVGPVVYWQRDIEGYYQFLRDVQREILPPLDASVRDLLRSRFLELRRLASVKDTPYTRDTVAACDQRLLAFGA